MPNHHDWELLDLERQDNRQLRQELMIARAESAKIVHALDCSTQLIEALIAWLPEGLALSPEVASAKVAWTQAMQKIVR